MKDLRYIGNEAAFLDYSYAVFGEYFSDRNSFLTFYNKINSTDEKNKFLKISSFYKFLIVDGKFLNTKDKSDDEYIDYLDFTYKYIAIFSFIEALYSKDEFKEFYGWLKKQPAYPLATAAELDDWYEKYNEAHGSTRKAIRFFKSLDDESKKLIREKFKVRKGGQSFTDTDFAKIFYKIRNNFIHNADLVVPFTSAQIYFTIGNKAILSSLSFDDMKLIFERGFLIYFEYDKANFKPKEK